ncbi:unnamed protein product [Mytilus edulis]|uniref:Uncharacterized protein n=1 Tax=Mytilus edulis TaxID=6550 RepID=A0A8S3Q017_MYTED|nr:unnamed protein product [Mytilus edulis]
MAKARQESQLLKEKEISDEINLNNERRATLQQRIDEKEAKCIKINQERKELLNEIDKMGDKWKSEPEMTSYIDNLKFKKDKISAIKNQIMYRRDVQAPATVSGFESIDSQVFCHKRSTEGIVDGLGKSVCSTQRKYTCRKCVVIPEDFIQKLENNKNTSTTNASCQTSIDNQPDGSYLDSVASRFQESLVTSINTLNRDLPNRESDLTATIEKVNNIEQILKEKLATIITMLSHSNEERAQSDASLLEMGKKVKQTSVKLDQIQKDIKVLNSLQEPSLYELVEKSCMMIPIIKNATQDLPKDRKKMDGVVQQVQKLGNQIKTSSEEHQSKLEDINDTMHALSENTTKPIYACKVQNKFELLENEKLCTNIDVEKVSDKICNSDENLCTNFNEKNEHNDTFTPVVNSPKGNTQNKIL